MIAEDDLELDLDKLSPEALELFLLLLRLPEELHESIVKTSHYQIQCVLDKPSIDSTPS